MPRAAISTAAALAALAGAALGAGPGGSHPDPVQTFQIGTSAGGRPINGWRIGREGADDLGRGPDQRPALLIVAGLDGRHDFGSRVAISLTDRLLTDHAELLDRYTVYIVPDLNPDNDALFDQPGAPLAGFGRAPQSSDADRDGRFDEDPGEDLNGDGVITLMRVADPAPGTGLTATMVADDEEPRAMREPKADEGEHARYAVLIEGVDNDGDGRYNEDGIAGAAGGGIDLDRNFPSLWPEHADGSGEYALSRPETRRLVEWMLTRDNIVCALAYTPQDNILNTPESGKTAADGREPTGIEKGDERAYKLVQELFKESTGQTGAPEGEWAGSFTQYAYAHFGVWSFATPAWVRPDLVKAADADEGEGENGADGEANGGAGNGGNGNGFDPDAERRALQAQNVPAFLVDFIVASPEERQAIMEGFDQLSETERASRMQAVMQLPEAIQLRVRALVSGQPDPGPFASGGGGERPARAASRRSGRGAGSGKAGGDDQAAWIAYSDEHLDGRGFIAWTPFDHPQLGEVEIGGLVPGIRHEPPESEWVRVIDEQATFVAGLLEMLPELRVETTLVERVSEGLWRVRVRGVNERELPTRSAIGAKAERLAPIVVSPRVDPADLVTGSRVERWETIDGNGGRRESEWVVRAPDGSDLLIDVRSSVFGDRTVTVRLREEQ